MKKIQIISISLIAATILFIILTFTEKAIINKEPLIEVLIANRDITRNSLIERDMYYIKKIPAYLVLNTEAIRDISEIEGKYAAKALNKGQVVFKKDIGTKEELKIISSESGLEKIAIKIKESQNAVAYQIRPQDRIHLYFTGKYGAMKASLTEYGIYNPEMSENVTKTIELLHDTEILGIFDSDGNSYDSKNFNEPDAIVIAVRPEMAKLINNIRGQGVFDITA